MVAIALGLIRKTLEGSSSKVDHVLLITVDDDEPALYEAKSPRSYTTLAGYYRGAALSQGGFVVSLSYQNSRKCGYIIPISYDSDPNHATQLGRFIFMSEMY